MTTFRIPVPPGTPVRVYWNLPRKVWSVQVYSRVPGTRRHVWRVAGHANVLHLTGARFKVSEKGRQRVLATGVKNVHAYILATFQGAALPAGGLWDIPTVSITYNPVVAGHFHTRVEMRRVESATELFLHNNGGLASVLARAA